MKKLIAIIMVLCMALGLAGCGNSGDETTATPTEAPITVDGSMQPKTISAGCCFVAVREDGTVAESGCERCDVSGWTDIVQVAQTGSSIVGLKSDGTAVAVGDNEYGQCDVSDWKGIKTPYNVK